MPPSATLRALAVIALCCACGGGAAGTPDAAGAADAGAGLDAAVATTERCRYQPMPANANAGGTVAAGALTAGAAETIIAAPVGTALGGYGGRARFLGPDTRVVDQRAARLGGGFYPSVGIETAPRVKALALSAGGETVVILKIDTIFVYEGLVFDLEERLGDAYRGKLLVAASHSHSAWAQFTGHGALKVGAGELRDVVYQAYLDALERAARAALAARRPAQIGFATDAHFDPGDAISHDRRGENDQLPGGNRKDDRLHVIRVDGLDGQPMAIIPIFGVHGTLNGTDNSLASFDATGALERVVEEQFDHQVVVLHLQSAGADTSPTGHGAVDCDHPPGAAGDPCFEWLVAEGHARVAAPVIMAAWQAAGAAMQESIAIEMLTRSVELGPKPETFSIRGGALSYAPFDLGRPADRVIYDGAGRLMSPIDEFNAPVGAALCQDTDPLFPAGIMPGTTGLPVYGSCMRLDLAASLLADVLQLSFEVDATHPICSTTRTTISALRLGDRLIGTLPGEVSVLLADLARQRSPVDADHTIVVGYAQGHVGYLLRPEDWVLGGYEPSVTFWGPLEAEYLEERLAALWPLALTPIREDGAAGGVDKLATARVHDDLPVDDPAPLAGTVPARIPPGTWMRAGVAAQAQPEAVVPRVAGIASFVWLGDDPLVATPRVSLQREIGNEFADVTRKSGRTVSDGDLILEYTPVPADHTHVWAVEWQAVPWLLADDRAAAPLGRYRFHVAGKGWTLDSQAFTVVAGGLTATATRAGGTVFLDAEKGYRLLDLEAPSNRPVPLRGQPISVTFLSGTTELSTAATATDTAGAFQSPAPAGADRLRVTDQYGNSADALLR